MATSFASDFRRFFTRGLAAILPTVLTISLIVWLLQAIDTYVGKHISWGAQQLVCRIWGVPTEKLAETWDHYHLHIASFMIAISLIYIIGRFVASFLGRTLWRGIEHLVTRLPLIKQIYPSIKQVTDFIILDDTKVKFNRVVAVEYPRKGIWSMGLVTSPGMRTLQAATKTDLLTLFIPSSPTPLTGYTITVRRDEVIDLPFDIDQAFRFCLSGGVLLPEAEKTDYGSDDTSPHKEKRRLPEVESAPQ